MGKRLRVEVSQKLSFGELHVREEAGRGAAMELALALAIASTVVATMSLLGFLFLALRWSGGYSRAATKETEALRAELARVKDQLQVLLYRT